MTNDERTKALRRLGARGELSVRLVWKPTIARRWMEGHRQHTEYGPDTPVWHVYLKRPGPHDLFFRLMDSYGLRDVGTENGDLDEALEQALVQSEPWRHDVAELVNTKKAIGHGVCRLLAGSVA